MFLARKVKLSKWEPRDELDEGEISADAVTADLRTQNLSLSFWECGAGTESELEDVVLALASGANQIETLDLVWIQEKELRKDGHDLIKSDGRTAATHMKLKHVEIRRLDYVRLGKVADRVVRAIEADRCERFIKSRVTAALVEAVRQGRVAPNDLEERVRSDVLKELGKSA